MINRYQRKVFTILFFVLVLAFAFYFSTGQISHAQTNVEDLPGIDLTIDDVFNIIYGFACWLWSVAMVLLIIFIIFSGIRIMAAGANPQAATSAKQNFKYVILGAIVIMGTFVIISTIAYNIGVDISLIPFDCNGAGTGDDGGDDGPICGDGTCDVEEDCQVGDDVLCCPSDCSGPQGATLCTNNDYGGSCQTFSGDDPNLSDNGLNDNVSSIRLGSGQRAALFENNNFTGNCETFNASDPNLSDNVVANDSASSIKVGGDCGGFGFPTPTPTPVSNDCSNPQALAAQYNEAYPYRDSPELDQLIACIGGKLSQQGISLQQLGSLFTFEQSNTLCNYTRGNAVCGSCSYVVNSCHYGGVTGNTGARAVDIGNEVYSRQLIQAANECGARSARCETTNQTVTCPPASAGNSPNIHISISTSTCDR